jgi:hypothetical protein
VSAPLVSLPWEANVTSFVTCPDRLNVRPRGGDWGRWLALRLILSVALRHQPSVRRLAQHPHAGSRGGVLARLLAGGNDRAFGSRRLISCHAGEGPWTAWTRQRRWPRRWSCRTCRRTHALRGAVADLLAPHARRGREHGEHDAGRDLGALESPVRNSRPSVQLFGEHGEFNRGRGVCVRGRPG